MRALIVVCLLCGIAAADDRPWAKDVTAADQKAALALYDEGNKFFEESEYKEALEKYEQALVHWKHPAVYFNAAVCLHHLDQDVKAADYIDKAAAYKDAPFDKKTWGQVQDYQTMLSARVTELEVSCTQADAKITLDAEVILPNCPASATRKLAVQQDHVILGEKPGYQTEKIGPIRLEPGKKKVIELVLKPLPKGKEVRRWNRMLPWYVVGGGIVIAAAGIAPLRWGQHNQDRFEADLETPCMMGCQTSDPGYQAALPLHDRAKLEVDIATGMFVAGGAVIAAGVAMIWLNQPHFEKAPAVAPSIGPDHAGVVVFGRW